MAMGEGSFSMGRQCFLMNCQSMQEMLVPESTSAEESMTLRVCEGVINCTGIHIDLFEVDTSTGAHITNKGELCVEASLSFKNPCSVQNEPELLLPLHCRLLFLWVWGVSLPSEHIGLEVSWGSWRNLDKRLPCVPFCDIAGKVPSRNTPLVPLGWVS